MFIQYNICNITDINDHYIFSLKHPTRTKPNQEIAQVIKGGHLENPVNAKFFSTILSKIGLNSKLPDTAFLVYKNTDINKKILLKVYQTLLEYKLKRDQIVYQYAFAILNSQDKIKLIKVGKRYM
tara:strand:- start:770 stop:1144 length:375 start_codon:yes stop_codon:yes gene_type:complete